MKVGDTFFFEGTEFSIKNIDTGSTEKFPTGRVDASKFTGSHDDPENPRTIQRGRPKMFNRSTVAEALGEPLPTPEITSDVKVEPETKSDWSNVRDGVGFSTPTPTPPPVYSSTDW